jgi:hypothetical protein
LTGVNSLGVWIRVDTGQLRRAAASLKPQPCRPAPRARSLIVVARGLLDRSVLRLLHGFRQRHALPRRLGEVSGPQSVRGKRLRLQPCDGAAPLDGQIDRLRRERLLFPASQRSIARKIGPFVMSARSIHSRSAPTGGPTRSPLPSSSASPVLVRPSWIARHCNAGDFGSCGSSRAGGSSLNCSTRSRATSLRRRPPDANAKSRIARSRHRRADRSRR